MDVFRLLGSAALLLLPSSVTPALVSNYEAELAEIKLYYYAPFQPVEVDVEASDGVPELARTSRLKMIIHGWNANRDHIATAPIRAAYLLQGEGNTVLVADWANASALLYPTARQLVLPVGFRIGSILAAFMRRHGIDYDQVHLVGHSLGAHIAGNVGRYFGGRLGRITALDPAGPLIGQRSRDAVGSDAAQFVDAIHTDGYALGEVVRRGHADFYPNRGLPPQPGCETLDVFTLHACSHYRSTGLFAESIQLPSNFVACECGMEEIFDQYAACLSEVASGSLRACVRMGEAVDPSTRGTFFLQTSRVPPYGMGNQTMLRAHSP